MQQNHYGRLGAVLAADLINLPEPGAATIRPWVTTHDGLQPHLHFVPDSADVLSRVKAVTAGGLAFVLCWEGGARLGRCARSACSRAYVDTPGTGGGAIAPHAAATPKRCCGIVPDAPARGRDPARRSAQPARASTSRRAEPARFHLSASASSASGSFGEAGRAGSKSGSRTSSATLQTGSAAAR